MSRLNRAHKGVFHKMSSKQLHRYVRDPMTTSPPALVLVSGITRPSRGETCWRGKGGPIGHRSDGEKATAKAIRFWQNSLPTGHRPPNILT